MPKQYFDVRLNTALTQEQKALKEKMMFWAEKVYDDNNNPVEEIDIKVAKIVANGTIIANDLKTGCNPLHPYFDLPTT